MDRGRRGGEAGPSSRRGSHPLRLRRARREPLRGGESDREPPRWRRRRAGRRCARPCGRPCTATTGCSSWARTSAGTAAASPSAWAARRVRSRADPRHPAVRVGVRRCGIGAAMGGMRPIVEIMTVNFSLLALDQIINNAATLRHMSGGQLVPVVIRMTTGAGRQLAAQHSHSLEGWYAPHPRDQGAGAGDRRGRPWHAVARAAGPRSRADLRARLPLSGDGLAGPEAGPSTSPRGRTSRR